MQFLPQKQEIYLALLREYLHRKILSEGPSEKNLKLLRKLNIYEIYSKTFSPCAIDSLNFCRNILIACSAELIKKGLFLKLQISGGGIMKIDTRVVSALLVEIAAVAANGPNKKLKLVLRENEIRITYPGVKPSGYPLILLKKLNGRCLTIEGTVAISIPAKECNGDDSLTENDLQELLLDPLSVVKIHLSHVCNKYFL